MKRAEKDTVETISNATKEAKEIIRDAKIQANNIVSNAEKRLERLEDEIALLEAKYTAYKSNFCSLLKKQFEFLGEQDFDPSSMIDDRAWTLMGGEEKQASASAGDGFGAYTGDPQLRDESTLGGFNGGFGSGDTTSTSAVYTQSLSAGENFVDPFKPKEQKDYNPFDAKGKGSEEKKSSLKVANSAEERKKMKRATVGSSEAAAAVQKAREAAAQTAKAPKPEPKPEPSEPKREARPEPERAPEPEAKPEPTPEPAPERKLEPEVKPEPVSKEPDIDEIPTISHLSESDDDTDTEESAESIEGEVEAKKNNGPALIGEGEDDDAETDDDGFEFI